MQDAVRDASLIDLTHHNALDSEVNNIDGKFMKNLMNSKVSICVRLITFPM